MVGTPGWAGSSRRPLGTDPAPTLSAGDVLGPSGGWTPVFGLVGGPAVVPMPVVVVDDPPGAETMPVEPVFWGGTVPGEVAIAAPFPWANAEALAPMREIATSAESCGLRRMMASKLNAPHQRLANRPVPALGMLHRVRRYVV